nr:hypothetical protein TRUBI_g5 [Trichoderma rubi]
MNDKSKDMELEHVILKGHYLRGERALGSRHLCSYAPHQVVIGITKQDEMFAWEIPADVVIDGKKINRTDTVVMYYHICSCLFLSGGFHGPNFNKITAQSPFSPFLRLNYLSCAGLRRILLVPGYPSSNATFRGYIRYLDCLCSASSSFNSTTNPLLLYFPNKLYSLSFLIAHNDLYQACCGHLGRSRSS